MSVSRIALMVVLLVCLLAVSFPAAAATPADQDAEQEKRIAEYTAIINKNPNDAVAHYFRGLVYAARKDFPSALRDLTKAVELNPRYAAAFFNRGWVYSRMDDDAQNIDKAIEDYTRAIALDPSYGLVYTFRAYVYNKKEMYDQAIADCDKALELGVRHTGNYFYKAKAQEKKGQYEAAIATMRQLMAATNDKLAIEEAKSIIRSLGGTL